MKRSEMLKAFKAAQDKLARAMADIQDAEADAQKYSDMIIQDPELLDLLMSDGVRDYDDTLYILDKGHLTLSKYRDTPYLWDLDKTEVTDESEG